MHWAAHARHSVACYGAPYVLFGVCVCINYVLPYFMWPHQLAMAPEAAVYLPLLGSVLGVLLIAEEQWTPRLRPYLPLFWHVTLLYCLPFTATMMFLLTGGHVAWLVGIATTIIVLITLVDWKSFLGIAGRGLGLRLL